jgi:hypothetical protein
LQHELRGRNPSGQSPRVSLDDGELRRIAERTWHKFLKYGWPMHGPGDVAYPELWVSLFRGDVVGAAN